MKHLIIGAGNMGRRHGKILEGMGDEVHYWDVGFDVSDLHALRPRSILICTPPDTHVPILQQLSHFDYEIPTFVEKPIFTEIDAVHFPEISMVACNWRWCRCLVWSQHTTIMSGYGKATELDHIHFLDLFWEEFGKPDMVRALRREKRSPLTGLFYAREDREVEAYILDLPDDTYTLVNWREIHYGIPCEMFVSQMKHWRECVQTGTQSCNPIPMAVERTAWLLKALGSRSSPTTSTTSDAA